MRLRVLATSLTVLGALGAGCTSTAGPFVTHISSAGPGLLRVEKCDVVFSKWSSSISTTDCTEEMVPVQPGDPRAVPVAPPVSLAPPPPAAAAAAVAPSR